MSLVLVGEDHFDMKAGIRLDALLKKFSPNCLGLESTINDFKMVVSFLNLLEDEEAVNSAVVKLKEENESYDADTIKLWYSNQFRLQKVALDYHLSRNVPLIFTDSVEELAIYSRAYVKSDKYGKDVKDVEDFMKLKRVDAEKVLADFQKRIDEDYLDDSLNKIEGEELINFYKRRDAHSEKIIRKNLDKYGSLLHVGGLDHIFGDYSPNLADRLKDLNPSKLKLISADYL